MKKKRVKKVERNDIVERTRAAVCLLNTRPNDEQQKLDAFMTLFHPEYKDRLRLKDE